MTHSSKNHDEKNKTSFGQIDPKDGVTRRRFMTLFGGSVASLAVTACGGGGSPGVVATDSSQLAMLTVGGPTASTGTALASFTLKSATGGTNLPFTLGYAFKKGQIPSGTRVTGSISQLQVIPKNTWPDGSLKFAVVSGLTSLAAGTASTVSLSAGTPSTVANLTTEDLRVTGATASIGAGSFGTASWTAADWATPFMTWVSGPFMSSWIYRKPVGTDPHLVAWLEVRLYRGGAVEILPWIENGYLNVKAPTNKSATYTVTLGGKQRFSGAVDLPNHSRTVLLSGTDLSYWLGTAPQVIANHDKAYLQATGLVPTYNTTVPSSAAVWSYQVSTFQPLQQGNFTGAMGDTGYQPSIGLLPEWDVLYLVSDDVRAYTSSLMNAYGAGRYGIHYRDENTNRPFRFSSYPNLVLTSSGAVGTTGMGSSSKSQYTPAASGTTPSTWEIPHQPSVGFMAYLITGRFYFMEEVQFAATMNYLMNTDVYRKFSAGVFQTQAGTNTTRGTAWALRTLAQATCVSPDDDPLRTEFVASMAANVDFYHSMYIAQPHNPMGIVAPYVNYTAGAGRYSEAPWQQDFFTAAIGYALAADTGIAAASTTKLQAFFAWKAQSVIGRLGGTSPTEYLYLDAAPYYMAVSPTESPDFNTGTGPWYANWGEVYKATNGTANPGVTGPLRGGYFPEPTSYWGNLLPAIAYAVRHNVPGAAAAYARLTSASNWQTFIAAFANAPVWGVSPGAAAASVAIAAAPAPEPATTTAAGVPSWVPPVGYFGDVPMKNYPQDLAPSIYGGDVSVMDDPFILWGGSAVLRDFSPLGAQVYYSAGHETSYGSPNIQLSLICDFSTLTWSVANVPKQANSWGSFANGYAPDGTPYTPHTYLGLQEFPKSWGGGAKGSMVSFFWASTPYPNRINVLDVSSATNGYSQLPTRQSQNIDPTQIRFNPTSAGGNYPITVMDENRKGWWAAVSGTVSYTLFVSNTGDITQYPALGGNLSDGSMVLCKSLNLLVAIDGGYESGQYAGSAYRTLHIRDLSTSTVTQSTVAGKVPALSNGYDGAVNTYHRPNQMGLQWVDELGCIVGLDETTVPPTIVKLTPPASNPATGTWTWSTVPVSHWSQDTTGQTTLQSCQNAVWSKFRWVPALHAFVYTTAKNRKPQVVRIA